MMGLTISEVMEHVDTSTPNLENKNKISSNLVKIIPIMVLFSDKLSIQIKTGWYLLCAVCNVCILLLSPFAIINPNKRKTLDRKKKLYFRCISFQFETHQQNISIVNQVLREHHSFNAGRTR